MIAALSDRVAITPLRSWLVKAVSYALSRSRIGPNSGFSAWASGVCALAIDGTAAAAAMVAIPKRASFRFISDYLPEPIRNTRVEQSHFFHNFLRARRNVLRNWASEPARQELTS